MDRAQKAPRLGEKLAHGGGPELGEEGTSMHTAEVGEVPQEIQLLRNDAITRGLIPKKPTST